MDVRLLGPVEAHVDGRVVAVGPGKPRALLALLSLRPGSAVSSGRLVAGLWGDHPPATAAKLVHLHVSQLRKSLRAAGDGEQLVTRGHGYELRLAADELDVTRFERLVAAGRPREALALWRGPALADVAGEPFAAAEIRRLEELRLEAVELAIDLDLRAGRHRQVVGELERMVLEEPLRERLHEQRMLALYRSGRQADALAAYRHARSTLIEQVGVEPGPELARLHEAILHHDPALEPPAEPPAIDTSTPLVGRAGELERLRRHWRSARDGAGRLVLIIGPRGIGKTRLAAELAADVRTAGDPVVATAAEAMRCAAQGRCALLVVDDVDRAGLGALPPAGRLATLPLLVLATAADASHAGALQAVDTLTLAPLDREGVRTLAQLHAEDAELPLERLFETTGGVPGQVQRAAMALARDRRLRAAASRLAAEGPALRAAEVDLAGDIVELQADRVRGERPAGELVVCPFKGLASFEIEDAEFYFGRERLVAELIARMTGTPLIGIVGASGSGKSSLLRAGLLAALGRGVLPGSERWPLALLRPGDHPVDALDHAVRSAAPGARLIVAIDQFEELFTACRDDRERGAFTDALCGLVTDPRRPALGLIAVRADFYGRCADYAELSRLLAAGHALVGQMRRHELRRAIELPARRAGLEVEPELVDSLLADVEDEPGALPLLSTALVELWQHRAGRRIGLDAYRHAGGVDGAVARLAERAYDRLSPEHRPLARSIMLRLAGDGDDGAVVRRRVPLTDLEGDGDGEVLTVLAQERLVTIGAGEAEVAHEALLREWPRLRRWLEEDADGRRVHRRLVEAARAWSEGGRERGDLYRGARLAAALEWRSAHPHELNPTERQFLDAARAAGERARRRVQLAVAAGVALLAIAIVAAVTAVDQRGRARAETQAAEAQALAARAVSEQSLDRALLLARQAVALDDAPATRDGLLAVLRRSPAAVGVIPGDGDALTAIAVAPDGRTLAIGDDDGTILFLDAGTRHRIGAPYQVPWASRISSLAFSPDGRRLASAGWAPAGAGVDLFDTRSRRHLARLGDFPYAAEATVHFSPDSRVLAAYEADAGNAPGSHVSRWDARSGRPLRAAPRLINEPSALLGFLRSSSRLVTVSESRHHTVIRNATSLRPMRRFAVAGSATALSSRAGLAAFGGQDGSIRILDLDNGKLRIARGRHAAPVVAMRFDAEGHRLVSAGRDERLIVWDAQHATALETLEARGIGLLQDLQIARDGRTAYSAGRDGTVVAWDLSGERRWERPVGTGTPVVAGALTTGGEVFAVVRARGHVDVFDSRTLRRIARFGPGPRTGVPLRSDPDLAAGVRPSGVPVSGAAVAPDGRTLALTTDDGRLAFWDLRTRRRLRVLDGAHANPAWALSFSADGRWLATGGGDALLRLWDARRLTPAASIALDDDHQAVSDVDLSPDGTTLAVTLLNENHGGGLEIRSTPSLNLIRTVDVPVGTVGRFSTDGRSLVYAARDGRVLTLDTRTWTPLGRPIHANPAVVTADLSPDGRLLATTSTDHTGALWDIASGRPVGASLSGARRDPIAAAFVDRGNRLVVMHDRGGVAWDVDPAAWARHACRVAGRPLTRSEWEAALPQHSYAPACEGR